MSQGGRRLIVVSLILGAHALLGYVLLRESAMRTPRPADFHDSVSEAITAALTEKPQLAAQPLPHNGSLHDALRPAPIRDVSPLQIAPIEVAPEPITRSAIDWSSEASAAAADVLERARRRAGANHFDHVPKSAVEPGNPGVFGSEAQNHRAGKVEDGSRFWVTDNCYYDFPRGLPPPPRMAGEIHLMTPTCKPPPTGGGNHVFEDLKPEYLRALPKIPAK